MTDNRPEIIAKGLTLSEGTRDAINHISGAFGKAGIRTITIHNNVESRLGGGDLIHFDALEIEQMTAGQREHFEAALNILIGDLRKAGQNPRLTDPKGNFDDVNIAIARNSAWRR